MYQPMFVTLSCHKNIMSDLKLAQDMLTVIKICEKYSKLQKENKSPKGIKNGVLQS